MSNKIIRILIIFSLCSIPLNLNATNETGGIEGNVIEQDSRLPLEGSTVQILGTELTTTFRESVLSPWERLFRHQLLQLRKLNIQYPQVESSPSR